LANYLSAHEIRKPEYYRAAYQASKDCLPTKLTIPPSDLEDAQIAEATSSTAMEFVLALQEQNVTDQDVRSATFLADAYATVGVGYHRAAGVYVDDDEMQELGTAAVHLLTIATSYMARND
jgi:choline dehydrogenase-like flavoprotein